jgi:hypothetical protein
MLDYLAVTLVFALACSVVLVFIRLGGQGVTPMPRSDRRRKRGSLPVTDS